MKTRHDDRFENDPTPSGIVVQRYREDFHNDDSEVSLALVHYRGGKEEFSLGVGYCQSDDPLDRAVGADVLSQLGWSDQTFLDETVDLLIPLLEDMDPRVVCSAAVALGHRSVERAIPHLLRHANHQNALVRYGVVYGISGSDTPDAIAALIDLTTDEERDVRDWAVFGLGSQTDCDSPAIRNALWASLTDSDSEIRGEALVGLARRKDPRAKGAILAEWERDDVSLLSIEAAKELGDSDLLGPLLELQGSPDLDEDPFIRDRLAEAVAASKRMT